MQGVVPITARFRADDDVTFQSAGVIYVVQRAPSGTVANALEILAQQLLVLTNAADGRGPDRLFPSCPAPYANHKEQKAQKEQRARKRCKTRKCLPTIEHGFLLASRLTNFQ